MQIENLSKVLEEYNIEVISIRSENYKVKKGVWWIKTKQGYKILKKNSIPSEKLNFIIAAMEYLSSRGIHLPEIIESKKGKKYVEIDGANYILNEAIDGKAPSSKNIEGLEKIVKELGKFHAASKGFQVPSNSKPNILLGVWERKARDKMKALKQYYDEEKAKSEHSEFGEIILNVFPSFYEIMNSALSEHNSSQYHRWAEEVKNKGCLVHQDFIDGNLILTDVGEIYVLDPDSISIDIPARDIRKILNKVMKKRGSWDLNMTRDILNWYQEKNPLELWQWQVVKSTIMFPHLFVGLMSKYYENREKSWSEKKYIIKLKGIIATEKSKKNVLDNFQEIISALL